MTDLFATITAADERQNTVRNIPELFREPATTTPAPARAFAPARNVNILALDFGMNCGWGTASRDGALAYGTERFDRMTTPGSRWSDYRAWLSRQLTERQIHVVYFEDVKAHAGIRDAHAYGAFKAITAMVCDLHRIPMVGVGVSVVKKAWTGKGNAKKEAMVEVALAKGFRIGPTEHDTADALAILSYAVKEEA